MVPTSPRWALDQWRVQVAGYHSNGLLKGDHLGRASASGSSPLLLLIAQWGPRSLCVPVSSCLLVPRCSSYTDALRQSLGQDRLGRRERNEPVLPLSSVYQYLHATEGETEARGGVGLIFSRPEHPSLPLTSVRVVDAPGNQAWLRHTHTCPAGRRHSWEENSGVLIPSPGL